MIRKSRAEAIRRRGTATIPPFISKRRASGPAIAPLGDDQRTEIDEIVTTLSGN
jgi:hypothetical protein